MESQNHTTEDNALQSFPPRTTFNSKTRSSTSTTSKTASNNNNGGLYLID